MSSLFPSTEAAKETRRSRRCAVASYCALFSLVMFAFSGHLTCVPAQSLDTPKPGATPETKQGQKPGANESASPAPATGTIKGRVVSDDGRPVTTPPSWLSPAPAGWFQN